MDGSFRFASHTCHTSSGSILVYDSARPCSKHKVTGCLSWPVANRVAGPAVLHRILAQAPRHRCPYLYSAVSHVVSLSLERSSTMKVMVHGRNVDVTDYVKEYV